MDKEPYFTRSTQFQELSWFFVLHFQPHIDILHYKIPSAITNKLMPLCLILTTNQCKTQGISRTKNGICNFHKTTSCGITFCFEIPDERSLVVTLHTIYYIAFCLF